jgi:hypothetical protein
MQTPFNFLPVVLVTSKLLQDFRLAVDKTHLHHRGGEESKKMSNNNIDVALM